MRNNEGRRWKCKFKKRRKWILIAIYCQKERANPLFKRSVQRNFVFDLKKKRSMVRTSMLYRYKESWFFNMLDTKNVCINSVSFLLYYPIQIKINIFLIIKRILLKNLIKYLILYCNLIHFKATKIATISSWVTEIKHNSQRFHIKLLHSHC